MSRLYIFILFSHSQETEIIWYTRKEYTSGCNETAGNLMADLMEAYLMRDILVGNCNYTPYGMSRDSRM